MYTADIPLPRVQHLGLPQDAHKTQPYTHTSHKRATAAPRLTIETENTTSITPLTQTHNILHRSNAKKTVSLTTAATQQTFPHSYYNGHKNKHAPYTYIYYRTLAQLITYKSPFSSHTYTKSMPTHIHHHYSPFGTHSTHIIYSTAPNTHHVVTTGFMDRSRRGDGTAGQMVDHKREDRTPPTSKGQWSG